MLEFLIKRPIAVLMSMLAFAVLGILAFVSLPVSLLPDIDIPYIKVQYSYHNTDARSIENTITKPLRQQLSQVSGLRNIRSETKDGFAQIFLEFDYTTKTDYAFIETNEKLDAIISQLPRDLLRPIVIKEKPSDIPVFYINIIPRKEFYKQGRNFQDLSRLCDQLIKRRIEQLNEISLVDISGLSKSQIIISPETDKMKNLNISYADINRTIEKNNIQTTSLNFNEGHYVYNLRLLSRELTVQDISNLSIYKNGRIGKIGDIANVYIEHTNIDAMYVNNNTQAVSMAIYKQSSARMQDVKAAINIMLDDIETQYPEIQFSIERDQTQLLEFSINNLLQTLLLSIIMAIVIMLLFIKQIRLTAIIALSIPITLIISFFFLYLAHISITIISLSGLILSVGLMIDNSIIVIDNINQYKEKTGDTSLAAVIGTNEVIRPLISSVLTTCAVFLPLISLSGIAGAVFYDQAITISISLIVSLFVSIMVIPVLYRLFIPDKSTSGNSKLSNKLLFYYELVLENVMSFKRSSLLLFLLIIPLGLYLYTQVDKQKLPIITQHDFICSIIWNENIDIQTNRKRVNRCIELMPNRPEYTSVYLGKNEFLLSRERQHSTDAAYIYFDYQKPVNVEDISNDFRRLLTNFYPEAQIEFSPSENIFQSIFSAQNNELLVKFRELSSQNIHFNKIREINEDLSDLHFEANNNYSTKEVYEIYPLHEKILLYKVEYQQLLEKLKILFGGSLIEEIRQGSHSVNILIRQKSNQLSDIIQNESISNSDSISIPLSTLVKYEKVDALQLIYADKQGEYYGVSFSDKLENINTIQSEITHAVENVSDIETSFFSGAYEQEILFVDLIKVLLISLLLLYLILAAQFESLILPLIILFELLFDIAGALLFLFLFSSSLNLMSALGIIVMSGIVINDSIIKIDTIHRNYKNGMLLLEAIRNGGQRRFLPIIMTSLTTVFALLPLLFFKGLGIELQLPLALSIIGGLSLGTIISLFFIPLMYYYYGKIFESNL